MQAKMPINNNGCKEKRKSLLKKEEVILESLEKYIKKNWLM